MARAVVTAPADADTAFIISDLAVTAGALVAVLYDGDIDVLYRRLEAFPESGSPGARLGRFVRVGLVSPYVAVYRRVPDDDLVLLADKRSNIRRPNALAIRYWHPLSLLHLFTQRTIALTDCNVPHGMTH